MEDSLNIKFIKDTTDNITRFGVEAWNDKRIAMKEANIDKLFNKNKELAEEEKECSDLNRITIDLMIKNKKITYEMAKIVELKEQRRKTDKTKTISIEDYKKKHLKDEVKALNNAKMLMSLEEYVIGVKKANITSFEDLQHFDCFDNLKILYDSKHHPTSHSPPLYKPVDDETTNFSSNDNVENKVFIFHLNDYYWLNKHDNDDESTTEHKHERK